MPARRARVTDSCCSDSISFRHMCVQTFGISHLLFCVMRREMFAKNALARKLKKKKKWRKTTRHHTTWVSFVSFGRARLLMVLRFGFWEIMCVWHCEWCSVNEKERTANRTSTYSITTMSNYTVVHTRGEKVYFISILLFIFLMP